MKKEKTFNIKDIVPILMIILLTLVFFSAVIFSYNYKIPWDAFDQQYPWINSTASSISSGKFPLWSDNFFSGFPTFEDPQVGTFYPFNILLSIFCRENGYLSYKYIELNIVLHYMLMGIFTYVLCRNLKLSKVSSLFAAIIFEFCGYMACHPQHYSSIMSLTWLPLSLSFLISLYGKKSKKSIIGFIISFALCILGGHIQTALYSGMFLFLITIMLSCRKGKETKKSGIKFFITVCILFISAGLIAGIQLLPTVELMKNSTRSDMTYEEFSSNSNDPITFVTAIMPYFLDIDNLWYNKEPTETHLYLSVVLLSIIILFVTREKKDDKDKKFLNMWIISTIVFFVFSLGENTFVSRILYLIPFVNKLRRSVNYFYIVSLLIAIIGGYALNYIINNKENLNYGKYKKIMVILNCILLVLIVIAYIALFNFTGSVKFGILKNIIKGLWTTAIFINIVWYFTALYINNDIGKKAFSVIILSILVIDLFTFNSNIKPNASNQNYNIDLSYNSFQGDTYVNEILRKANEENVRVAVCGVDALNASGIIGVSDIWGYNPLKLSSYNEYARRFSLDLGDKPTEYTDFSSNYIDLLSTKYILTTSNFMRKNHSFTVGKYSEIYNKNNIIILQNNNYIKPFYTTSLVKSVSLVEEIYDNIGKDGYNPENIVYVLNAESDKSYSSAAEIIVKESTDGKTVLQTKSNEEIYLTTSKIMYSGWKIKINGKVKNPDTVNGIFIGTSVPQGENTVEIYYAPNILYIGIFSSAIGVMILIICVFNCKMEVEK